MDIVLIVLVGKAAFDDDLYVRVWGSSGGQSFLLERDWPWGLFGLTCMF